ncbi:Receptor like protein 42 [Vitis vinifera]|uniref:Receptor like protein 42 n=1 Tax=Vitis vinifera TaxID=29760 RepID=A0A438GR32_VITVI|nr:Receptor like protein 42 [Vitis vinifera]
MVSRLIPKQSLGRRAMIAAHGMGSHVIRSIPTWLENLTHITFLHLDGSHFSGFSKIKSPFMSLRIIDLVHNDFKGDLPKMYLRSLKATMNVDEGHIPSSFRNLKLLKSLDLSSNKLLVRIPQELTSLTFLEVLNLFKNRLTRFIPRGNQFETFGNDSCGWNLRLCGFPLSKKCSIEETLVPIKEVDAEFESGFD